MTSDFLKKFADEHGFTDVICTSAKTGLNVTTAVGTLVRSIILKELKKSGCSDCDNQAKAIFDDFYSKNKN